MIRRRRLAGLVLLLGAAWLLPAAQPAEAADSILDAWVAAGRLDRSILATIDERGSADAIVQIRVDAGASRLDRAAVARTKEDVLAHVRADGAVLEDYESLPAAHVRVASREGLGLALGTGSVDAVRADRGTPASDVEANALIRQPHAAAAGYGGAGTAVAVLDTGVDYRHADFGSCTSPGKPASCRVAVARDFAPADHQLDGSGHGTNVAGIVATTATRTTILSLDIFDADGLAWDSDILAAIDWVIEHRATWNVRAINLSIADSSHWLVACPASSLQPAFESANQAGITVTVASGNSASPAGVYVEGIAYPACSPAAVSVGAVYDADIGPTDYGSCAHGSTRADRIPCFSQGGSPLTLLAPGAAISAGGQVNWHGTSMAAPFVAAAAAILAAAQPSATVERIRYVLRNSGPLITDPRGAPARHRLNVDAAAGLIHDVTKPKLTSRKPAIDATGVSTAATVRVTFSEPVNGVSASSMRLEDALTGHGLPATITYEPGAKRATLVPAIPLLPGHRFTVVLTSAIRDRAGNRLIAAPWSFRTAPPI